MQRSASPSATLRAAKQQVAAEHSGGCGGGSQLNRSSTKKLLNLIKTKTKTDLTLRDGDEDDEIAALLGALENESIDNIDWDELGLDEDEVKGIIAGEASDDDHDDDDDSSEDNDDEEEDLESEEEDVETSSQHFIIRS